MPAKVAPLAISAGAASSSSDVGDIEDVDQDELQKVATSPSPRVTVTSLSPQPAKGPRPSPFGGGGGAGGSGGADGAGGPRKLNLAKLKTGLQQASLRELGRELEFGKDKPHDLWKLAADDAVQTVRKMRTQRGAMAGGPINASYAIAAAAGTPDDANWIERLRDDTLSFFVRQSPAFEFLASLAIIGIVAFGVLIVVALFPVVINLPKYGTNNPYFSLNEKYQRCEEDYLNTIGQVTTPGTSMMPPKVILFNSTVETWAAPHCTDAQKYFTMCIKAFTFIFSYINFLPIPWRLSIFVEAFFGRPMIDDELQEGCDFYGRPTEALWFHLERRSRVWITVLLNLAWILHFVAQITHLVFWTHVEGNELGGTLAQNVPFISSILCNVAAGVIQGKAEKRAMKKYPGRFPPKFEDHMKEALGKAVKKYKENLKRRGKKPGCCFMPCCWFCSKEFYMTVIETLKESNEEFNVTAQAYGGTTHALTGINLAGATKVVIIKDADSIFGEIAGSAAEVSLQALTRYLEKTGNLPRTGGGVRVVYDAANASGHPDGITLADWKVAFAKGVIPGHEPARDTPALRRSLTSQLTNAPGWPGSSPAAASANLRSAAYVPVATTRISSTKQSMK